MREHKEVGTCLLCIELRWGVGALCIIQFFCSCFAIFSIFIHDVRMQPGGYNPHFIFANNLFESLGILLAITGLRGVWQGIASWVWGYLLFLYGKSAVSAVVFFADLWELSLCKNFSNNIAMGVHYSNATMEHVAVKGLCEWTMRAYVIGWGLNFACILYFTYVTHLYYSRTKYGATYLLRFPGMSDNDHLTQTVYVPGIGDVSSHFIQTEFDPLLRKG